LFCTCYLYFWQLSVVKVGTVEANPKGIKSATSLPTCIEWCPGDDDLLLVGQQNGEINLMRIPDGGLLEPISTDDAETKWNYETGSVLNAVWHPTVGNAVLTSCKFVLIVLHII